MHVCLKVPIVWVHKYACRGRRSTLDIIPLDLATLFYEPESLTGLQLINLPASPGDFLVHASPLLESQACITILVFFLVELGVELLSSWSQGFLN